MLPAFAHASRNSELAALVSDDPTKLRKLGKRYGVPRPLRVRRNSRSACKAASTPCTSRCPTTCTASTPSGRPGQGVHVLCEKPHGRHREGLRGHDPRGADRAGVKLMVAYRLHFEAANLTALEAVKSGEIGEPRIFNSVFTMQVKEGNIRVRPETGGGHALGHRHLLHQRRAVPVPRRAGGGVRVHREQRREAVPRGGGDDERGPAVPEGPAGRLHLQLRRRRRRRATRWWGRRATCASTPPTSTRRS